MVLNKYGVELDDTGHLVAALGMETEETQIIIDYHKRGYCKWKLYDAGSEHRGRCRCEEHDPPNTYLKCYTEGQCDVTWRMNESERALHFSKLIEGER